ncbi:hypothetical protein [Cyclobacterium lianum]|uniref:hypothetical protein n=1 Tax=Cyclobacterium lianum TaxID=388280 RepID=UPI0015B4BDCA|nr:hypothetical protein [Cyclobacterium lianum]
MKTLTFSQLFLLCPLLLSAQGNIYLYCRERLVDAINDDAGDSIKFERSQLLMKEGKPG